MIHQFPFFLILIISITLLMMLANRFRIAYPIVLVIAGLVVSLIPSMPQIAIDHELIFTVFLPPLLYESAWNISWKEFWRFRRIISSFAFPIVLLTSLLVAWVASHVIPGFSIALGFLLGGIVSPPDAVSASAIMNIVRVPKSLKAIIEGESLLNDASSLIVFRFALIAVETGTFVFHDAAASFVWVIAGGVAIGLLTGGVFYLIHKWLPTDVNMDIVFTLTAPYVMYLAAEKAGVSGVLSVVSGGLLLAIHQDRIMNNTSRLRTFVVLSALGFILNGLVFILIGLELPVIIAGLGQVKLSTAIGYGVLISMVLIVGRLVSVYGSIQFTRIASRFITTAGAPGSWKGPFIFGWSGMRGVVSLAAALSIPPVLSNGQPFPERDLILFITFIVILFTLLLQGLTMPLFINKLQLDHAGDHIAEAEIKRKIHQDLAGRSLHFLQTTYANELTTQPSLQHMVQKLESENLWETGDGLNNTCRQIYFTVINKQREWLHEINGDIKVDEEIIRRHLRMLDLEEERIRYS